MFIFCLIFSLGSAQINFSGPTSSVKAKARATSRGRGQSSARVSGAVSSGSQFSRNKVNFQSQSFSSGQKSNLNARISIESSNCLAASQCSTELFTTGDFSRSQCSLPDGSPGFICNQRTFRGSSRRPFANADASVSTRAASSGGRREIRVALRSSDVTVSNLTRSSARQYSQPRPGTATFYHAKFQRQAERSSVRGAARAGLLSSQAALHLTSVSTRRGGQQQSDAVNFGSSPEAREDLQIAGGALCSSSAFSCSFSKFRTPDGSCNNLREPRYGMRDTALNRILLPEYHNGVDTPRRSVTGLSLPSPRLLSTSLAPDLSNEHQRHSYITMTFGQFIDHDITHSPVMKSGDSQDIDCCRSGAATDAFCAPIEIPQNDPFFRGSKRCMNLVRSVPAPALDCSVRYREQINQLTHWLDASQIYGSELGEQRSLRTGQGGRLQVELGPDFGSEILPTDNDNTCEVGSCFKAGDGRVNENPLLSVMHTVFMREHNRVADILSNINPAWSDERLYQEAKRIVSAEYQHIVYNEWLPAIVGKRYMNQFGLYPLNSGFSDDYDSSIDPRITNEFSSAAFRFGHSLIPGIINVYNKAGRQVSRSFQLKDAFNKPQILRVPGMVDGLVAGLTKDKIEQFDTGFVDDVTNHLFAGDSNGMDLVALNIQRGRDHGLAGYNKYREICNLGRANSFSDFSRQMSLSRAQELQRLYSSVDDVDLFVGIFSERPNNDAMVGPTALCIIGW